jgi:hypothetical protein
MLIQLGGDAFPANSKYVVLKSKQFQSDSTNENTEQCSPKSKETNSPTVLLNSGNAQSHVTTHQQQLGIAHRFLLHFDTRFSFA